MYINAWKSFSFFVGINDMEFCQPVPITDNYLPLMANTKKITNQFHIFVFHKEIHNL